MFPILKVRNSVTVWLRIATLLYSSGLGVLHSCTVAAYLWCLTKRKESRGSCPKTPALALWAMAALLLPVYMQ